MAKEEKTPEVAECPTISSNTSSSSTSSSSSGSAESSPVTSTPPAPVEPVDVEPVCGAPSPPSQVDVEPGKKCYKGYEHTRGGVSLDSSEYRDPPSGPADVPVGYGDDMDKEVAHSDSDATNSVDELPDSDIDAAGSDDVEADLSA